MLRNTQFTTYRQELAVIRIMVANSQGRVRIGGVHPLQHPSHRRSPYDGDIDHPFEIRLTMRHLLRSWFAAWYNDAHRHSGLCYVSPGQRHAGADVDILAARHRLYTAARERNPARWSRHTRNWTPVGAVTLNPERDRVVHDAVLQAQHNRAAAA